MGVALDVYLYERSRLTLRLWRQDKMARLSQFNDWRWVTPLLAENTAFSSAVLDPLGEWRMKPDR